MKLTIITHAIHKMKGDNIYAYGPYVREMNLWLKYVDEVMIVAPVVDEKVTEIESCYKRVQMLKQVQHDEKKEIQLIKIASFDVTTFKNSLKAVFKIPSILFHIYKAMQWADHIHLRCPGNIGLLGCIVQISFPNKPKTVKYAGNWDSKSQQPVSYRLQKWILSNTFLTRNAKVLVYGEWLNQRKNITPFFTASYSESEIVDNYRNPEFNSGSQEQVRFEQIASFLAPCSEEAESHFELVSGSINMLKIIFVGTLSKGKQPILSVKAIHKLKEKGISIRLDIYGEGEERTHIERYVLENKLQNDVILHGNVSKDIVKEAYKKAHFLLFISKSEGWPKVVAEAMFWGCVPITSGVSCIPYMLNNGTRGTLISNNLNEIVLVIEDYLSHPNKYKEHAQEAMQWSQQFTLEKFEEEIGKLLNSSS